MSSIISITTQQFDEEISGKSGVVLIDFYADWCGPCRAVMPALEDIAVEFEGEVTIVKVDIDAETSLREKFGVQGIPAFALLKNGVVVEQFSGLRPRSAFAALIEKHLEN